MTVEQLIPWIGLLFSSGLIGWGVRQYGDHRELSGRVAVLTEALKLGPFTAAELRAFNISTALTAAARRCARRPTRNATGSNRSLEVAASSGQQCKSQPLGSPVLSGSP